MKALNEIRLPRVSKDEDFHGKQSEEMNQHRLNQNFRDIANAVFEHDEKLEGLPKEILAKVNAPAAYVKKVSADGLWEWRVWSDGTIEAFVTTLAASKSCTAASGSLFGTETEVSLPENLFSSVASVQVTPICSESAVLASIKSVTAAKVTLRLLTPASALVSAQFALHVIGK